MALESGRYTEAHTLIKSEIENSLIECFENYEGCSPPSYKSSLHLIAAMTDQQQAVRLCRELLGRIQEAANKECLLNATVVEELTLGGHKVQARVAAIHLAAYSGNAGIVRLLCQEYGVDVNCNSSETLEEEPKKGITALEWAARKGHTEVVNTLLANEAKVNVRRSTDGVTPLFIASQEGNVQVVKLLLDHKADVNEKCANGGFTPLYTAAWNGHTEVVKLLLDHKADVNASRHTGATPLYLSLIHI